MLTPIQTLAGHESRGASSAMRSCRLVRMCDRPQHLGRQQCSRRRSGRLRIVGRGQDGAPSIESAAASRTTPCCCSRADSLLLQPRRLPVVAAAPGANLFAPRSHSAGVLMVRIGRLLLPIPRTTRHGVGGVRRPGRSCCLVDTHQTRSRGSLRTPRQPWCRTGYQPLGQS